MNKISAKIVADSINKQGNRITTMEVVFPRFILAEFNTHRLFSRNSASSRAIPFKKMVRSIKENLFTPIAWQKDHSGMQGNEYHTGFRVRLNNFIWKMASKFAIFSATILNKLDVTKQLANRLLEPFMYHKVLVTFTESENFFNLRAPQYYLTKDIVFKSRKDYKKFFTSKNMPIDELEKYNDLEWLKINEGMGEIHIMDLAEKMWDALNESKPKLLQPGEWHIPYGDSFDDSKLEDLIEDYLIRRGEDINYIKNSLKIKIAIARCARLSYQTLGDNPVINYTADIKLFETLRDSGHFSPFEHVARCMTEDEYIQNVKGKMTEYEWSPTFVPEENIQGWNGNFRGFMQYRTFLENQLN